MIPGIVRGVIASSWLRAADGLQPPNSMTTGEIIPPVSAFVINIDKPFLELDIRISVLLAPKKRLIQHHITSVILMRKKP